MAQKRHSGFLARPLAQQARLGVRGVGIGLVAPAFSPEAPDGLPGSSSVGGDGSSLGRKLLRLAAASIRVPSTLKCSFDSSLSPSAAHTTSFEQGPAHVADVTLVVHSGTKELGEFLAKD